LARALMWASVLNVATSRTDMTVTQGFISIGSNIGRNRHIAGGVAALRQRFGKLLVSSVYEAEAVGFAGAPFYNLVVGFTDTQDVQTVAGHLRQMEFAFGRSADSQKFSPRNLDLDLLLYGDTIIDDGNLHIPRADITRYAFVLEPLAEIAPLLKHPQLQKTYAELWADFSKAGIRQQRIAFDFAAYTRALSP